MREFDLEAAKRGEKLVTVDFKYDEYEYVAGPNRNGRLVVSDDEGTFYIRVVGLFYMAPLAWVEDKPVYKGDVLYNTFFNRVVTITGKHISSYSGGEYLSTDTAPGANSSVASLTWTKPQVASTLTANQARAIVKEGESAREHDCVFSSPYEHETVEHVLFEKGWLHGEH